MKRFRAFARLAQQERQLLLEAFITLAICQVRLRVQSAARLQAWASRLGHKTIAVDRLAWAVGAASRRMPRATCLCRALALQRLLAKNGHGSELRIGVEKDNGRLGAHAWLIHNDQVLIGGSQSEKYELLVAWAVKN